MLAIVICLPSDPKDGLNPYIFLLDNLIVRGVQFALALLYLGSLYAQLDEYMGKIVREVGRYMW